MQGYNLDASLRLLVLLYSHRPAFAYDLRSRLHISLDDLFMDRISWNEVAAYAAEILKDPYSHSSASIAGYAYVPNAMDVFFFNWIDAQAQMRHQSGKVPPKPAARPWMTQKTMRPSTPDPGSAGRRSALRERLGLGGVVESDDQPDGQPEPQRDD